MSDTPSDDPTLDTCGCCDEPSDPPRDNRPGLPAIRWRPGTWSTMFQHLKDALSTTAIADGPNQGQRPLTALTTRADDDPAIAWLDACAVVGEILSFYQERIANEGFLRTATERRSVLELARQIGYELGPGVAASTALAFTLDAPLQQVPGMPTTTPETLALAVGTQVKSMPASGQLPQTFETIAPITAAVAYNAIALRSLQRHNVLISDGKLYQLEDDGSGGNHGLADTLWVQGTSTNVRVGDLLVVRVSAANRLDGDPASELATGNAAQAIPLWVTSVTPDFAGGRTALGILQDADTPPPFGQAQQPAGVPTLDPVPLDVPHVRDVVMRHDWSESDLAAMIAVQKWDRDELLDKVEAALAAEPPPYDLFVFRTKTGVFGHNAPASRTLPPTPPGSPAFANYDTSGATIWTDENGTDWTNDGYDVDLFFDRVVDGLLPGGWVALAPAPGAPSAGPTTPDPKISAVVEAQMKTAANKELVPGKRGFGGKGGPAGGMWHHPGHPPPKKPTPVTPTLYLIEGVHEASLGQFAISGKASGVRLDNSIFPSANPNLLGDGDKSTSFGRRNTTAWSASDELAPAEAPLADILWNVAVGQGATDLLLDRMVLGLAIGQSIALTGTTATLVDDPTAPGGIRAVPTGVEAREVVVLWGITHARGRTRLTLKTALENAYVRATVVINANVALGTHGETVSREVLGNGDGAQANQTFTLAKSPLTYVSAPTPSGGTSTLVVEVNGVFWREVPSLYTAGPTDRVYMLRHDDDGSTHVIFGDGIHGARLPTGAANVLATYRVGTGLAGDLDEDKLTILSSRPLGLKSVTNPLPATGAAEPEHLADAQVNAPRTVRTLDRVVSIDDYQDFARSFLGIGKAQAVPIWSGQRLAVQITIASAAGTAVDPESLLYQNLCAAILDASDGAHVVYVDSFRPIFFKLDVKVAIDDDYDEAPVIAAVESALESAFAFAARDFGQPVSESEIIAVVQPIAGVVAVSVRQLYYATDVPAHHALLTAESGQWKGTARVAAQLLLLHPVGLTIEAAYA